MGKFQLLRKYEFAAKAHLSILYLTTESKLKKNIYLNLCQVYYEIGDLKNLEFYARKALDECFDSKAMFWLFLKIVMQQQSNTCTRHDLNELASALTAVCVYFGENPSDTIMMIEKQGCNVTNMQLLPIDTSEELTLFVTTTAMIMNN